MKASVLVIVLVLLSSIAAADIPPLLLTREGAAVQEGCSKFRTEMLPKTTDWISGKPHVQELAWAVWDAEAKQSYLGLLYICFAEDELRGMSSGRKLAERSMFSGWEILD